MILSRQLGDDWECDFSEHAAHEMVTTAGEKHMSEKKGVPF